jgi:multiple sugar transport system ATP-binding protein
MNFFPGKLLPRTGGLSFQFARGTSAGGAGIEFIVPEPAASDLRSYANKKVLLGVRPEHIQLRTPLGTADELGLMTTLEAWEPFGSESHVYLVSEAGEFTARTSARPRVRPGDKLPVLLEVRAGHYFDEETGMRLAPMQLPAAPAAA